MNTITPPEWMVKAQEALHYYQLQLEITAIEKCNAIVQIGEMLTLTHDEKGRTYLHNTFYPTCYTQELAEKLAQGKFSDSEGNPVKAKVVFARDWYQIQRDELQSIMPQLQFFSQMNP